MVPFFKRRPDQRPLQLLTIAYKNTTDPTNNLRYEYNRLLNDFDMPALHRRSEEKGLILRKRIIGYDLARALAVFGMVVVNFKIVMGAEKNGPAWLAGLVGLLDGRAAATFVVLAGAGLSLLSQKGRMQKDRDRLARDRHTLLKRALFLFIFGLLYTPIWPADILHFYGVYIALAAFLLSAPCASTLALLRRAGVGICRAILYIELRA